MSDKLQRFVTSKRLTPSLMLGNVRLNKRSFLVVALGVTEFIRVIAMVLVTLCSAT